MDFLAENFPYTFIHQPCKKALRHCAHHQQQAMMHFIFGEHFMHEKRAGNRAAAAASHTKKPRKCA